MAWPPSNGVTTPVVPREKAVLAITASTRINAPASDVLAILRDAAHYGEWNTWVREVTIRSQPAIESGSSVLNTGTLMTFHSVMDDAKPQKTIQAPLKVTDVSTPDFPSKYISPQTLESDGTYSADLSKVYRIAWRGQGSLDWFSFREERFLEVTVLGEKECELRSWEMMGGLMARVIKWKYAKVLQEKTEKWCDELKRYAEEKA